MRYGEKIHSVRFCSGQDQLCQWHIRTNAQLNFTFIYKHIEPKKNNVKNVNHRMMYYRNGSANALYMWCINKHVQSGTRAEYVFRETIHLAFGRRIWQ